MGFQKCSWQLAYRWHHCSDCKHNERKKLNRWYRFWFRKVINAGWWFLWWCKKYHKPTKLCDPTVCISKGVKEYK